MILCEHMHKTALRNVLLFLLLFSQLGLNSWQHLHCIASVSKQVQSKFQTCIDLHLHLTRVSPTDEKPVALGFQINWNMIMLFPKLRATYLTKGKTSKPNLN